VVRPLDEQAREALERCYLDRSIRCEWLPILDEEEFIEIWKSGLLQHIGATCNLRFTDYEEIMIDAARTKHAAQAVKQFLGQECHDCRIFAESLIGLLLDAKSSGMPVLFIL
jgi:hypothetical protein